MPIKNIPDGTGGGGRETWARIADIGLQRAIRENRETWCHLVDYHAAMVLKETDPGQLHANLQSLIDACLEWQREIQSRPARLCKARVPDNGDNTDCGRPVTNGDSCDKHAT